jgi:hypothetical protein
VVCGGVTYKWNGKRYVGTEDNWSFGYDLGDRKTRALPPDSLVATHKGDREEMAVTPAQHPSSLVGKSWTRADKEPQLDAHDMPVETYIPG